jgi:hypothetical protein
MKGERKRRIGSRGEGLEVFDKFVRLSLSSVNGIFRKEG